MKMVSFIPYHIPFEETILSVVSSAIFRELELANQPMTILSEIIERPQYGYTASASNEPTGIKYVRITDIQAGNIDWNSVPYCECDRPEKYLLRENDILFARTGGTTGKSLIVKGQIPKSVFASYLIRIRPKEGICPDFLHWFFQTKQYWSQIKTEKMGSAQPNVNGKKLSSLKIVVPQIEAQRILIQYLNAYRDKIYGKSAELPQLPTMIKSPKVPLIFLKIDELRKLLDKTEKEIEKLVPSILDKAFKGEL
jgi:type I restriction enzyme S subunit